MTPTQHNTTRHNTMIALKAYLFSSPIYVLATFINIKPSYCNWKDSTLLLLLTDWSFVVGGYHQLLLVLSIYLTEIINWLQKGRTSVFQLLLLLLLVFSHFFYLPNEILLLFSYCFNYMLKYNTGSMELIIAASAAGIFALCVTYQM